LDKFFEFILSHRDELLEQTIEHLMLTLISLSMAIVLGVSLGLIISKRKKLSSPVLAIVNAVQTIPSIALLGFLLPFLGIGATPAIVALFLYALLPIVRNTFTGIEEINPSIKEAAIGMGMTPKMLLLKVELPLAMPVIFAGVRTAFVINVGVATLCALIAAGGLGEFIFRGLSTNNPHMILAGAIPAALMALTFDRLMGLAQKNIRRIIKPLLIGILTIGVIIIIVNFAEPDSEKLEAGFPSEFIEREDGYRGLAEVYNLDFQLNEMEIGLMYDAINNEKVDVISGFSTDGRIKAFNLLSLEDDKKYFPPYHAAPLATDEVLNKYPGLDSVINRLGGLISNKEMTQMNYLADEEKQEMNKIAQDFLLKKGFNVSEKEGDDIIIGSKNFTESYTLAYLLELLIETEMKIGVDVKPGFGGTKILFDALNEREVDIYPEYTGTGLLVILGEGKNGILYQKDSVYQYVKQRFKDQYGLTWLKPFGFNNTFALMMRRKQAQKLGVKNISDLANID